MITATRRWFFTLTLLVAALGLAGIWTEPYRPTFTLGGHLGASAAVVAFAGYLLVVLRGAPL